MILALVSIGCNSQNSDKNKDTMSTIDNNFNSAQEAFEQTKKNLPKLLDENRRKAFGLGTDEEINNLVTTAELPVLYLSMDQLKDSVLNSSNEGLFYFLGDQSSSKICVGVVKGSKGWVQSVIGLKIYVGAVNRIKNSKRIIDVPGLEISFIETTDSSGNNTYHAITSYPDAGISESVSYTQKSMLMALDAYKIDLEKKYGREFMNGDLER